MFDGFHFVVLIHNVISSINTCSCLLSQGETYKLFWPDQPEFVRMAAKFGATIVPFGVIGEDDMAEVSLFPLQDKLSCFILSIFPWLNKTYTRAQGYNTHAGHKVMQESVLALYSMILHMGMEFEPVRRKYLFQFPYTS